MWDLAGHQILLGGGRYDYDHGDPMVTVHCFECPDGTTKGWVLWRDMDETGDAVEHQVSMRSVVEHLKNDGVEVTRTLEDAALFMASLEDAVESGLDVLAEQLLRPKP